MWRNPKYQAATETADRPSAPKDNGELVALYPRGPDAELRVCLAEFEGRPYLAIRVWERGTSGGAMFPTKKGCSIRLSEAGPLAEVLAAVADGRDPEPVRQTPSSAPRRAEPPPAGRSALGPSRTARGAPKGPRGGPYPTHVYGETPPPPTRPGDFDECAGDR